MDYAALPTPEPAEDSVARRLYSLKILPPQGQPSSPLAASLSGKTYCFETNAFDIRKFFFDFSKPACIVTVGNGAGEHQIVCGAGVWQEGMLAIFDHNPCVVASGTWVSDDTFVMTLRFYQTPFVYATSFQFAGDQLNV